MSAPKSPKSPRHKTQIIALKHKVEILKSELHRQRKQRQHFQRLVQKLRQACRNYENQINSKNQQLKAKDDQIKKLKRIKTDNSIPKKSKSFKQIPEVNQFKPISKKSMKKDQKNHHSPRIIQSRGHQKDQVSQQKRNSDTQSYNKFQQSDTPRTQKNSHTGTVDKLNIQKDDATIKLSIYKQSQIKDVREQQKKFTNVGGYFGSLFNG